MSFGIASCMAAPCLLHGWAWKWGKTGVLTPEGAPTSIQPTVSQERARLALERVLWVVLFLVVIFIVRPAPLTWLLDQVPLYRSLRFAFREIYVLLFFCHLIMALRPVRWKPKARRFSIVGGVVIWLLALLPWGPPSLLAPTPDRQLISSGQAQTYWRQVQDRMPVGNRIVPEVSPEIALNIGRPKYYAQLPQSLVGASNLPALFGVHSYSGYNIIGFGGSRAERGVGGPQGLWAAPEARALQAKTPGLTLVHLVSLHPMRIQLETDGRITPLELPPMPEPVNLSVLQPY